MGIYLPIPIVAALLAFFYGKTIHRAWLSAIITFACVMLGGLFFSGVGQIAGIVVSAVIIFFVFTRPDQKRAAREAADRDKDASQLPNEEDM